MTVHRPTFLLAGDRVISDRGLLLEVRNVPPFDRGRLTGLPWTGVDLHKESQGSTKESDSIQFNMARHLEASGTFDVLLDDDGAGEIADLVGLKITGNELAITLAHCKYSKEDTPGARLADLYEVCGQALRSARWRRRIDTMLTGLAHRAGLKERRTGVSPFEVGDAATLLHLQELAPQLRPRMRVLVAQPGISAARITDDQLQLLAGAQSYLKTVAGASLEVVVSP